MMHFYKQGIKPPSMQMIKATPNTRFKHQQLPISIANAMHLP
jgi:hypothetical protein